MFVMDIDDLAGSYSVLCHPDDKERVLDLLAIASEHR